ncbi:MAG: UbiD family decarboxylase [Candidatus Bathyarchaeia archaeon]
MSFREFFEKMEKEGEVLRIKNELSTSFEIPFVMKSFDNQGPILVFEKVKNHETMVVANVCGTRKRICAALDVEQDGFYRKLIDAWRLPKIF